MPIADPELRALETALRQEAEETLRARGWDGHVVLVRNPFEDELALRVQATARLANQQAISGHEIEMMRGEAGFYAGQILRHMLNQYPALPGSRDRTERNVTDLRRLEEMGLSAMIAGAQFGLAGGPQASLKQPRAKKPPVVEPEPLTKWERLMGEDAI